MRGLRLTVLGSCLISLAVACGTFSSVAQTGAEQFRIRCDFQSPDDVDRENSKELIFLTQCLRSPDPAIRDGIGYAVMADILRNHRPDAAMLQELRSVLIRMMPSAVEDPEGVTAPFVMLALSEVVRADRVEPWMSEEERLVVAKLASDYLIALDDYRGFDETEGWRHGVAHTADVFLQFALNPAIGLGEAQIMLDAIATKVAPADAPAYVFGEPDRLARPVLFLARSGVLTDEDWTEFFEKLLPDDDPRWVDPYMHEAGLRALHNTKAFAYAIYVNAAASATDADDVLADGALDLLGSLP